MEYYEIAFTNSGVTIKLDVMQGLATLYASDYIWNLNAESYDWKIQTNLTSMYGEEYIHPSNLNRTAGNVLFLGVLGGETANVYILNNTLGDTTTKGICMYRLLDRVSTYKETLNCNQILYCTSGKSSSSVYHFYCSYR